MIDDRERLRIFAEKYAEHQYWRCGHPRRFPWPEGDCLCGLVAALREAELPVEWAAVVDEGAA